jgi:hypothetical protein
LPRFARKDRLLFFLDDEIRVDALVFAIFDVVDTLVNDIGLACGDELLAFRFTLIKVVLIDLVAEVTQHEIGDDEDAGEPYNKAKQMKHSA